MDCKVDAGLEGGVEGGGAVGCQEEDAFIELQLPKEDW